MSSEINLLYKADIPLKSSLIPHTDTVNNSYTAQYITLTNGFKGPPQLVIIRDSFYIRPGPI